MRWTTLLLVAVASCARPRAAVPSASAPAVTFRHRIVVTGPEHDGDRRTWTLRRDRASCALEEVTETSPPIEANAVDDEAWKETGRRSWSGRVLDGDRCELSSGRDAPRRFVLACRGERVPVLSEEGGSSGGTVRTRWRSRTKKSSA